MKHEVIILDDDDYDPDDNLAPEYDVDALRVAARAAGFDTRARLIRIASDVLAVYPNEEAVNQALRELIVARSPTQRNEVQSTTR